MTKRRAAKKRAKTTCTKDKAPCRKEIIVVEAPGVTDVLFGRGGHVNHNPANQRYLELVGQRKEQYHSSKKTEKAGIAWDIMIELRQQDPPTNFLKKDCGSGLWHVVEDAEVRRKISQCLRERGMPVRPTSKRQEEKTSTTRLRLSLRTCRRVKDEESKAVPDEDHADEAEKCAPQISPEQVPSSYSKEGCQATRLGKQLHDAMEQQDTESLVNAVSVEYIAPPPSRKQAQVPFPQDLVSTLAELPAVGGRQQVMQIATPVATAKFESCVPPPMPTPVPLKQEGSNRVWSDFFTRSFASFTPSIFDISGGAENAWENLLDPCILPPLAQEDDESFPGSCSTEEQASECTSIQKRSYSQSTSDPCEIVGWVECISPPPKRRKTQADVSQDAHPVSVDSFFNANAPSLGKVLEQSHVLNLSSTSAY
jgi:hypothetical protein